MQMPFIPLIRDVWMWSVETFGLLQVFKRLNRLDLEELLHKKNGKVIYKVMYDDAFIM